MLMIIFSIYQFAQCNSFQVIVKNEYILLYLGKNLYRSFICSKDNFGHTEQSSLDDQIC